MERLIFVDSNIWCYYFDRSSQEHNIVSDKLEQVLDGGVAINTVVELEVAHYLIKNLGSEGKRKTGIGGRDATILASMEELEIDTLMTPIGLSKG
jgi:predicted nucleic acid-binding protein